MPAESLREIAAIVGGVLAGGDAGTAPTGWSIDSRTLKPGDLFFAIVGEKQDGHRFAGDALAKGACAVVVSSASAVPKKSASIFVKDTTRALQDLAASRRARLKPQVVGITGSSGKTTTKEMTRQVLAGTFRVMASRGNLNNLYGLPLSLLDLSEEHQVAVLEMGMSSHGELTRLAEIADPDVGVLTNTYGAHLAFFEDIDDYASAKAELFQGMRPNTTGIFNNDDERSRRIASAFGGYAVTFGMESGADFTVEEYEPDGVSGCRFVLRHAARRVPVRMGIAGAHHAMNATAAMATGFMLGCDLDAMAQRLGSFEPAEMRGRVYTLRGGVRVLDDSYNANPSSMRAAIGVLARSAGGFGRRIAVIGDMLELGANEKSLHQEIGRVVAAIGADMVFTVGPLGREIAAAAIETGAGGVRSFSSAKEAIPEIVAAVRPGDVVLVKASRGVGLDKVVSALVGALGLQAEEEKA